MASAAPLSEIRTISDVRLIERAFRQGWTGAADQRETIVRRLREIADNPESKPRLVRAAVDTLAAADAGDNVKPKPR